MLHRGGDIWYLSWWMSRNWSGKKLSKIEVKIQVKETVETVHTKTQGCDATVWGQMVSSYMLLDGPVLQAECLCPSKLLCWNLVSNVMAFRIFGRLLDHEGGAFTNGISALMKGTPKSSMQGHWEDCHLWTKKQVLIRLNLPAPWSWTSLLLELWEILFFKLLSFWYSSPTD